MSTDSNILQFSPRAIGEPIPTPLTPVGGTSSLPTIGVVTPKIGSSAGNPTSPRANQAPTTISASPAENQTTDRGHVNSETLSARAPVGTTLFDPTLYTLAQWLDDVEGLRKAQANRLRILTTTEPDEDGVHRGFGYDETHPVVAATQATLLQLEALEHAAVLDLQRTMRKHPLNEWRKTAKGVGEKQLARLLAAVGDPYVRMDIDQPRTVSQLWAYCGLHVAEGAAAKRQKGVKSNWSADAKTRAYLIATSCIKQPGEYRQVYLDRREHTATTQPDWTPGHSHNDALRILSKRVLRDLWRAARDLHEGATP